MIALLNTFYTEECDESPPIPLSKGGAREDQMNDLKIINRSITIIRWTARIVGLLYIAFFLLMLIGEGLSSSQESNPLTVSAWLGFVFVFIYFVGLILAWKWEGIGGLIAIGGTIGFFVTIQEYSLLTVIMAVPALLFLVCWSLSRSRLEMKETWVASNPSHPTAVGY